MKKFIRNTLVKLLVLVDKGSTKQKIVTKLSFWYKEIHLPPVLTILITGILAFVTLMFEIGTKWPKPAGLVILLVFIFVIFINYIRTEKTGLSKDKDALMLIGALAFMAILGVVIVNSIKIEKSASQFYIPVFGIGLLTALLLKRQVAAMIIIVNTLACGMIYGFKPELILFHLISGFIGIYFCGKIRRRQDIFNTGLLMALVNCIILIDLSLLGYISFSPSILKYGIINSAISIGIIFILLFPLETVFSRLTTLKLIELSDFNQPLLKRLMVEAPGTYNHSLTVAIIAEQASESIHADSLLVRVGAYYHDIGKLIKPEYFIENQVTNLNPHDTISASMSGLVVISHAKEGVSLAKKHRLDKPIINFIEQHHGTSLLQVFYQKSMLENGTQKEENFRYPGPKPATRETAILMLADTCEAATRSLDDFNITKLKDMVERIINEKFSDGQFNETKLTFFELNKITKSIVNSLINIHHIRIEYETKNGNKNT